MVRSINVLAIEIVGTIFIIFVGGALHFTYVLSGNNPFVGCFSAVNESVWEHLKLPFWPSVFWILISMFPLKGKVNNFFASKAIGAYTMVIFIPMVFYSYTAFTGASIFAVDISSFVVAVIIGQYVSYRLFNTANFRKSTEIIAVAGVTLLASIFIAFTFYPPHLLIFQDPMTGDYGI